MRTEQLIAELAARATPFRPLPSPGRRAIGWLLLASVVAAVGLWIFGPRADVIVRLGQFDFAWVAGLALASSVLAAVATLVLAIPGAERTPVLRASTLGVAAVWALTMSWAVWRAGGGVPVSTDPHWPACFSRVVIVAVVPALALFVMSRRALPLRLGWSGALAASGAASMGALVAQLACPLDDAGHAFLGHFVSVVVVTAIGLAARRMLQRTPVLR